MSGKPKITEHSLRYVISQSDSVREAAEKAGVSRWTIRRLAQRWTIDLATAFKRSAPATEDKLTPIEPVATPDPLPSPHPPQHFERAGDIRILTARDFSGPFRGDVSSQSPVPDYLARYHSMQRWSPRRH